MPPNEFNPTSPLWSRSAVFTSSVSIVVLPPKLVVPRMTGSPASPSAGLGRPIIPAARAPRPPMAPANSARRDQGPRVVTRHLRCHRESSLCGEPIGHADPTSNYALVQ